MVLAQLPTMPPAKPYKGLKRAIYLLFCIFGETLGTGARKWSFIVRRAQDNVCPRGGRHQMRCRPSDAVTTGALETFVIVGHRTALDPDDGAGWML